MKFSLKNGFLATFVLLFAPYGSVSALQRLKPFLGPVVKYCKMPFQPNLSLLKFSKPVLNQSLRKFLRAETLFYKPNGEPITEKEHDILYDIKLRKQFPMSLEHGDGTVPDDEIAAIQAELDEKLPGVKVVYIPTTPYEVLFIKARVDNEVDVLDSVETGYDRVLLYRQSPEEVHRQFNQYAVRYLGPHLYDSDFAETVGDRIIDNNDVEKSVGEFLRSHNTSYDTAVLKNATVLESELQKHNACSLYRGTWDLEKVSKGDNQSLSFGSTLFSGEFYDRGACAYEYITYTPHHYAVLIKKSLYANGHLRNFFHIPPLTTISGLFGKGEFFHARSKIIDGIEEKRGMEKHPYAIKNLVIKTDNPQATYNAIFEYLRKNRTPLLRTVVPKAVTSALVARWALGSNLFGQYT